MKIQERVLLIGLVLAVGLTGLALTASADPPGTQDPQVAEKSVRERFALPNLFNFGDYQNFFRKHYKSLTERAMRAKVYLAQAFRVFISAVSYKHRKSSAYLSVNHMSDWTEAEFEEILLKGRPEASSAKPSPNANEYHTEIRQPVLASVADVREVLQEVVEHKESSPVFAAIAQELETTYAGATLSKPAEPVADAGQNSGSMDRSASGAPDETRTKVLPDIVYIDHRSCLSPVQNQDSCGCCYAFATMALYEWAYCKAKDQKLHFSKQYVVDCGDSEKFLHGCAGGSPIYVRDFVLNFGLLREGEYKYKAKKAECEYPDYVLPEYRGSVRMYDSGYEVLLADTVEEKLKTSPLVMVVSYDPECSLMKGYGGGVDNQIDCVGDGELSHAMLLVGSGQEDGSGYFLLRNSFGDVWGVDGYYKMNKRHGSIIYGDGLLIKFGDKPTIDEAVEGESAQERGRRNNLMMRQMYSLLKGVPMELD